MRTTVTLDPDVAAEIQRLRGQGPKSLKGLINEILRLGLQAKRAGEAPDGNAPLRTRAVRLGEPLVPLGDIEVVLAAAEGEGHG